MRDHSHYSSEDTGYCSQCGHALAAPVPSYGQQRVNKAGLIVTLLLHLLLVALYLFRPEKEDQAAPPSGTDITYIQPLPGKPKPKEVASKAVKPVKRPKQEVVIIERLKDTITLPDEKPVKPVEPEPEAPKPEKIDPADDMAARIAARQQARGQDSVQQQGESAADRGNRLARENIERANGKSRGEGTETDVAAKILSFNSAYLEFKGYNPAKKRIAHDRYEVELGLHKDIETASVKRMVALMRTGGNQEVRWDSKRLGKIVVLSVRPADTEELETFLYAELFPRYRRRP